MYRREEIVAIEEEEKEETKGRIAKADCKTRVYKTFIFCAIKIART